MRHTLRNSAFAERRFCVCRIHVFQTLTEFAFTADFLAEFGQLWPCDEFNLNFCIKIGSKMSLFFLIWQGDTFFSKNSEFDSIICKCYHRFTKIYRIISIEKLQNLFHVFAEFHSVSLDNLHYPSHYYRPTVLLHNKLSML